MKDSDSNFEKLSKALVLVIVLFCFVGFVGGVGIVKVGKSIPFFFGFLSLLVVLAFWLKKLLEEIFYRIDGLKGEYKVSTILKEMWPDGVRSVDDIVLSKGHGNIDHVAVARTGVWVIETKHISGTISLLDRVLARDGKVFSKNFLQQAFAEGKAVREYLLANGVENVPIRPMLVFSAFSKVRFGQRPVAGVFVISSLGVRKLIMDSKYDVALSAKEIEKITGLLREYQQS
ncbi:MAG: nuclease-related domain-containing protein [Patescibacteria group bacterium]|jgi:hypothetical protein